MKPTYPVSFFRNLTKGGRYERFRQEITRHLIFPMWGYMVHRLHTRVAKLGARVLLDSFEYRPAAVSPLDFASRSPEDVEALNRLKIKKHPKG